VDCATNPTKLETLAINLTGAFGLAVATDAVYFTTRPDNTIWRVSK
jgi:fluoride ion exporter CrcB/FEX